MKLKDIQRKARTIQRGKEARSEAETWRSGQRRRRSRRPSNLRIAIWVAEFIVLLAVFEMFVLEPYLKRNDDKLRKTTSQSTVARGRDVVALGDRARMLAGMREVAQATLPPVDRLGDGSRAAQKAQEIVSVEQGLPIEVENSIGMRFRLIPRGTFVMGSPENEPGRGGGEKQHVREIHQPFYMGKHEVTQAQWDRIMETDPSRFAGGRRPVEEVTWLQCMTFARTLTAAEEAEAWSYRLPSEAQWEYACRAGTQTAFFFGSDAGELGKYDYYQGNSDRQTHPVGRLRPNAWGLHDLHGNVWEWCIDEFRAYPGADAPAADDVAVKEAWRVIRGGNWYLPARDCRAANRARLPAASHGNMLGFRLIRTIPSTADENKRNTEEP